MVIKVSILMFFFIAIVRSRTHAPVAKNLWHERCSKHALALNDCNWCHCGRNLQYICTARNCDNVDMFGHFNDAISQVEVGMEGKGVWRSKNNMCEPGVHYRKGNLLCVCTENGLWPNPVCRDIFQVLHIVEPTQYKQPNDQKCSPNKLYQIGCNVCYCLSSGRIDPNFCTRRNCSNDIIEHKKQTEVDLRNDITTEVYAACVRSKLYRVDCQTCVCLPNNRLLCDNCTKIHFNNDHLIGRHLKQNHNKNSTKHICSDKIRGERFKNKCNTCYCDKDTLYCTTLNCLEFDTKILIPRANYENVDAPVDDLDCVPGTKYKKDCSTCYCFILDGVKYFGCTKESCDNDKGLENNLNHCVEETKYEKNCLICQCITENGLMIEICNVNDVCQLQDQKVGRNMHKSLQSMHGYCEPLHSYIQDCNQCKCLSNGQIVACTSKICSKYSKVSTDKSRIVEFIPFIQTKTVCPSGHSFKVDCNICHCLSNGNTVCTTKHCESDKINTVHNY